LVETVWECHEHGNEPQDMSTISMPMTLKNNFKICRGRVKQA